MFDFEFSPKGSGTHSLLSVSGGGLLGVIPAAMLVRYEALGKAAYGADYRLSDSFHSVAGSSTGAVIAAGVALGLSARDIADFYLKDVQRGFKRRFAAIPFFHDLFDGDLMEGFFQSRTEGRLLNRSELNCDLTILTKDLNRGQPVAFTTVQRSRDSILGAEVRREAHCISKLLRASTAAPGLFAPVHLQLEGLGMTSLADGGFSLFNDPTLLAARLVTDAMIDGISITSLGTGSSRATYKSRGGKPGVSILRAVRALFGLIKEGEAFTEGLVRELVEAAGGGMTYRRHDMCLSRGAFAEMKFPVSNRELRDMRKFADFSGKERLFEAASEKAEADITEPLALAEKEWMPDAIDRPGRMGANCAAVGV